jgi:hypothetical protein
VRRSSGEQIGDPVLTEPERTDEEHHGGEHRRDPAGLGRIEGEHHQPDRDD